MSKEKIDKQPPAPTLKFRQREETGACQKGVGGWVGEWVKQTKGIKNTLDEH